METKIWLLRIYDAFEEFVAYQSFEEAVNAARDYMTHELDYATETDFEKFCDGYSENEEYFYIYEIMDCYPITYYMN